MFDKKPDLKDKMIELLEREIASLRLEKAELQKQLIALVSRGAYRDLYPRELTQEVKAEPSPSLPVDPRRQLFQPTFTHEEIIAEARKRFEETN